MACTATAAEEGDATATSTTLDESESAQGPPPSGPEDVEDPQSDGPATPPASVVPDDGADVRIGHATLGDVLVDADGFTLYGYVGDVDGVPTCSGACTDMWPAALVEGDQVVAPSLEDGIITRVEGVNGSQLVAGRWPLYRFDGDSPGQANGHGLRAMFYAVTPDGELLR